MSFVVCLMIKNEESTIEKTILSLVENNVNIYIFDTGSSDCTLEILSKYPQIVVESGKFVNYSVSRNETLFRTKKSFPNHKFILMLDAEWILDYENIKSLRKFCLQNSTTKIQCFNVNIVTAKDKFQYPVQRLFNSFDLPQFVGEIHEKVNYKCTITVPNFVISWKQTDYGLEKTRKRIREFDIPYYMKNIDSDEAFYYLGQSYLVLEDIENAKHFFDEVVKNKTKGYFTACLRLIDLSNTVDEAKEYLNKSLTVDSDRVEPYILFVLKILNNFKQGYIATKRTLLMVEKETTEPLDMMMYETYRYIAHFYFCVKLRKYREAKETILLATNLNNTHLFRDIFFKMYLSATISCGQKEVILILTSPEYRDFDIIMAKYLSLITDSYFFYLFKSDIDKEYEIDNENHYIYLKGEESFIPGILDKTLKVFQLFYNCGYDQIIRLNATTFVDFYSFGKNLSTNGKASYFGYYYSEKLIVNPKYGITEEFIEKYGSFPFVSGKFIYLNRAALTTLLYPQLDELLSLKDKIMDDVYIALALKDKVLFTAVNTAINYENLPEDQLNNMVICRTPEQLNNVVERFIKQMV